MTGPRAASLESGVYGGARRRPWNTASGLVLIASLAMLFVILAANTAFLGRYLLDAIRYPFEIDYGEGIVWWQMAGLGRPGGMYTDVNAYPYIVYHYPPLYHAVSFIAAALWGDALAAGRAVSSASSLALMALSAATVFQAAGRETPAAARAVGAAVAALLPFAFQPVFEWAPLMRVDMLALMLNVAGISLFVASIRRPRLFYLSGLVFVLAAFTKQTMITGAAACFAVSLLCRPRLTVRVLALSAAVGIAGLVALSLATDGRFLLHIVRYNANEYRLDQLAGLLGSMLLEHRYVLAAVALSVVVLAWPDRGSRFSLGALAARLRREPRATATAAIVLYVATGAVTALSLGKVGASYNHAIDWMIGWSLVVGLGLARLVGQSLDAEPAAARLRSAVIGIAVALAVGMQIYESAARWTSVPDVETREAAQQVLSAIERTPGPVWSVDMVLAMKAGKDVVAEPAIVSDLSRQGLWDQGPLLDRLREHWFDLVVVKAWRPTMYTPEMRAAVEQSYPVVERIGYYILYRPAPPG